MLGCKMRRRERGQILILVLAVMALGLLVIGPLLAYVDVSLRLTSRTQDRTAAYYAADAGVERVIGDLYQGVNVLAADYYRSETIKGYTFVATASLPESDAPPPPATDIYLDPGGCFGLRPLKAKGDPDGKDVWNYSLVLVKGESVKINWAASIDTGSGTEHCLGEIEILKLDENGDEVEPPIKSTGVQGDGDDGRLVAITLYVPGNEIEEGGTYRIKFSNHSYLGDDPTTNFVDSYAVCFKYGGDEDHTFTGSITSNPDHFITDASNNNEMTILAFNQNEGHTGSDVNTNTFSCDYVEVKITTDTYEKIYTFDNVTQGSGPHYSYTGEIDVSGPADPPLSYPDGNYASTLDYKKDELPGYSASELDQAGYDAIEAIDGDRHAVADPGDEDNACLWHEFHIDELPTNVTRIDVRWEGYQAVGADKKKVDDDELWLLIWNYEYSKYHVLDHHQQDAGYTWVKVFRGACKDYIITSTAIEEENEIVTITCYARQTPGPSAWWEEQTIEILSWNISWQ